MADWLIAFSDKKKKLAGGEDMAPVHTKLFVNLRRQRFISQGGGRKRILDKRRVRDLRFSENGKLG